MTDTTSMTTRTPWHLWVVGVLSLLWNGFGAYDFIMTTTQGEAYMRASGFDQAMIDYFIAMPAWMYAPWTLGVWGGVAGSILLLMRLRLVAARRRDQPDLRSVRQSHAGPARRNGDDEMDAVRDQPDRRLPRLVRLDDEQEGRAALTG
jgi:hypothetical protein